LSLKFVLCWPFVATNVEKNVTYEVLFFKKSAGGFAGVAPLLLDFDIQKSSTTH